jgi:hypothetical protein
MAGIGNAMNKMLVIATAASLIASSAYAHGNKRQLGDGKFSQMPQQGYVMACQTRFPGGGGAHRVGSWIKDGYWDPAGKPQVEGAVNWPNAKISIVVEGNQRVVRANNLPTHPSGEFPISSSSEAYRYDRNPNHIGPQNIFLRMPAEPEMAETPRCVPMGMIGFATSGVAIFNAFDLGGRDAPAYEIQDKCNGHPELTSQYHYHDLSPCLKVKDADEPIGWILDGFPILGPVDSKGRIYTNADLDACHGTTGPVLIDEKRKVMYHYRFTNEFPYTIGCFKGEPIKIARPSPSGPPPPRFFASLFQLLKNWFLGLKQ